MGVKVAVPEALNREGTGVQPWPTQENIATAALCDFDSLYLLSDELGSSSVTSASLSSFAGFCCGSKTPRAAWNASSSTAECDGMNALWAPSTVKGALTSRASEPGARLVGSSVGTLDGAIVGSNVLAGQGAG